jgi:hypothetical protein
MGPLVVVLVLLVLPVLLLVPGWGRRPPLPPAHPGSPHCPHFSPPHRRCGPLPAAVRPPGAPPPVAVAALRVRARDAARARDVRKVCHPRAGRCGQGGPASRWVGGLGGGRAGSSPKQCCCARACSARTQPCLPPSSSPLGDIVIEYVGELIRPSVADARERRLYNDLVGCGTYVFRCGAECASSFSGYLAVRPARARNQRTTTISSNNCIINRHCLPPWRAQAQRFPVRRCDARGQHGAPAEPLVRPQLLQPHGQRTGGGGLREAARPRGHLRQGVCVSCWGEDVVSGKERASTAALKLPPPAPPRP